MTTPTALALIDKLRHTPEILEAIRQQLNIEANDTTQLTVKQPRIYKRSNSQRDAEIVAKLHAGTHTRTQIAMEYKLSLPRINQIMQMNPNPNPVRVSPNAERDAKIVAKARAKVPRAEIAREFNLSVIRVNQIVGAAPKPKAATFADRVADALRKYDNFDDMTLQEECLVMVGKYEQIARRITQDLLDGMGLQQLEDKYPADMTGDIPWTAEHYRQVASIMYNFEAGAWRR